MIKRITHEIESIALANRIILDYPSVKAKKNKVNLHYFFAGSNNQKNLGDFLSLVVVQYMLHQKGLSLETPIIGKKDIYAIGSILLMGHQSATIWGTGLPFMPSNIRGMLHSSLCRKLDIRAVRGPMTRDALIKLGHKCPEIYGDPAIIMPDIYMPETQHKTIKRLIIPHFSEVDKTQIDETSEKIINMKTHDYKTVIDAICNSEMVLSSSLHGIILAESYGVPAVFYQDRPERFNFKYEDWYRSTGRSFKVYSGLSEARKAKLKDIPDLTEMRAKLMDVFPYDLWNGKQN